MDSRNQKPNRPNFIELGSSRPFSPNRAATPSPRDLPSPRSGEVPPALSPLDAFALQGRMLAARFEDNEEGKRLSRLPPVTIQNELSKPRPGYTIPSKSSQSSGDSYSTPQSSGSEPSGEWPQVAYPDTRHRSFHPAIQTMDDAGPYTSNETMFLAQPGLETVSEERSPEPQNFPFGRSESPEPIVDASNQSRGATTSKLDFAPDPPKKVSTNESLKSNGLGSLAPPRSPIPPRSPRGPPSFRSARNDSGDDSDTLSFSGDPYDLRSYERKPSSNSDLTRPRSPFTGPFPTRSDSVSSNLSAGEVPPPRRSLNFSRPLSPAIPPPKIPVASQEPRPSFESSTRMLNADSPDLRPSMDVISIQESIGTPNLAPTSAEEVPDQPPVEADASAIPPERDVGPAYIYTKYALPRGRVVSRASLAAGDWLAQSIDWDKPVEEQPQIEQSRADDTPKQAPEALQEPSEKDKQKSSPDEVACDSHKDPKTQDTSPPTKLLGPTEKPEPRRPRFHEGIDDFDLPSRGASKLPPSTQDAAASHTDIISTVPPASLGVGQPPSMSRSTSHDASTRQSNDQHASRPQYPPLPTSSHNIHANQEPPKLTMDRSRRKTKSKDRIEHGSSSNPDHMSPDEHLALGIDCHETGDFQKSTYHLRVAARAGVPTAMLLYALACRHGWGMRANQAEGVLWLRNAVDSTNLEANESEGFSSGPVDKTQARGTVMGAIAQREHRAQLALATYELGVSYLNGWGIAQDKALGVRCFEIAGGWGDGDALAEAGYCYAKGVGCKKDLQKAANLYRKAEEKGISMAGNSW